MEFCKTKPNSPPSAGNPKHEARNPKQKRVGDQVIRVSGDQNFGGWVNEKKKTVCKGMKPLFSVVSVCSVANSNLTKQSQFQGFFATESTEDTEKNLLFHNLGWKIQNKPNYRPLDGYPK